MDQHWVTEVLAPRTRADLTGIVDTDGVLAGGTSLMSEPNPGMTRLIDLAALDWPDLVVRDDGLEIAATCTIDTLIHADLPRTWIATTLFDAAARALLASYKIWYSATVGGNVCLALPAGAMTAMCAALDARLLVWRADGTDALLTTTDVVVGNAENSLGVGDVLRSIHLPTAALTQRVSLRKASYAHLGRSGAVVVARSDGESVVVTVTAATVAPEVITVASTDPEQVARDVLRSIPPEHFHTDAHGTARWRIAVVEYLVVQAVRDVIA
ncbi:FAD binding domain-containing protein [Williamsia herbipolensis]|uniref:FAD binding domain-containing protein n=1 Tax=Williamsia herbipolensis TaxID=1603258 RepID=A0AAU4K7Q5_9NOCA|nr:FAD binding domain-containing protein [Williamsia herbipolensis]